MMPESVRPSGPITFDQITTDPVTERILEIIAVAAVDAPYKFVAARRGSSVLFVVGLEKALHADILAERSSELFGEPWCSTDAAATHTAAGVTAEGAKFLFHPKSGEVEVAGLSGAFGQLSNTVFGESTRTFISRYIASRLSEWRAGVIIPPLPTLDEATISSIGQLTVS